MRFRNSMWDTAWSLILLLGCLAVSQAAAAEDREILVALPVEPGAAISGDPSRLSDAQLERRVAFLSERFADGQRNAQLWQYGFTGAWATGVAVGGLQAGLATSHDDRIPGLVTAGKAAIGTTRLLLFAHPGIQGSGPLALERGSPRETLEARLIAGETHLLEIEHKAGRRKSWLAHAANLGLNGIGAGIIVGIGNPSDAILNAGVGILFGELMLWTMPWRGEEEPLVSQRMGRAPSTSTVSSISRCTRRRAPEKSATAGESQSMRVRPVS